MKSCSCRVWVWSCRFWSALGAHSHWQCHTSSRDQGWLVPLCLRGDETPVQSAGDFQSRDTHPPLPLNAGESKGCVVWRWECSSGGTLWASGAHKGDCHGNAEVPRAHRGCSDMPSYHKMKEHVFILFFQVRVNYVFPKIG